MVISAETPTRPSDPAAESTAVAVAAAGATAPRGEAKGSLLHNFSFPILKTWGSHRVLRCMSVNGKGEVVAGGGRRSAVPPEPAGPRIREEVESEDGDDPGIKEVREKLLVHLREAADRMKLVVPSPPKDAGRKPQPAPAQKERLDPEVDISAAAPARPWNLRTRRGAARAPTGIERHLSGSLPEQVVKRTVRRRSEDPWWRERPKFSISLTKEEIEEDIYAVTGRRARQRPRKRARVVQKQLDALFPGSWLTEITADTYRVPDSR
ncbi:hypothetical protein MUK42_15369 [Musa troglodytarum]|uniref:Uncharacterized protein n=1 Tax=Musa troglodytarum TaxID=320322 RepID=A0A9E7ID16_9LILI|nr:hypothetical protein MUK42_15369 [Musa troglodytarum]